MDDDWADGFLYADGRDQVDVSGKIAELSTWQRNHGERHDLPKPNLNAELPVVVGLCNEKCGMTKSLSGLWKSRSGGWLY
jgi:hypothetical protein